jgi:ATP-binding cassette subfamily B protein
MRRGGALAELVALAGRGRVAALAALELGAAVVPLAVIAVIGTLVARVATSSGVAGPLVGLSALLVVQQLLVPLDGALAYRITRDIDGALRARVAEVANRPVGLAALEDPAILDRLVLAGGDIDHVSWNVSPGGAVVSYVTTGARYVQAGGAALLLAAVSPVAALVLTSAVLLVRVQCRRWARVRVRAIREHLTDGRAGRYTSNLASTPPTAKEARLFGLLEWLLERHRRQWASITSARSEVGWWFTRRSAALLVALAVVAAIALVAIGRTALGGDLSPRTLAVALQAAVVLAGLLDIRDEAFEIDFGMEAYDTLRTLEAELPAATTRRAERDARSLPVHEIRFVDVCFAYPGGAKVFDHLDLTIPAGSSLAVVGANGAGKTTLVKLLGRLYEPDGGAILVDGVPLPEFDVVSWRRQLAVIFQDFVRYELTVADNVGFGGVDHPRDQRALAAAAARAGALGVVERLPSGWGTPLSRQYAGGAELSGGEWQRIALARALFAVEAGATVLVLDEPTANLDVRAEAELFDRFLDLTRGLTTILISHRFSTVRRADRICVLEGGRVVELGNHRELVTAGGRYAELFGLQAARFDD